MSIGEDLLALSRQKWEWMSAQDVDRLTGLFHEEAIFVHMGATFTKEQELDVIRTGFIHYRDADIRETTVRSIGDTGIVLTLLELGSVVDGHEVSNPFAVTEVYVHSDDRWQLGSMSFTRLTVPLPAGSDAAGSDAADPEANGAEPAAS